jgi:SAM-dependent methyltransferase
MTVLDVGVGTGRLLSHFPEARRYGIDVSINYAERLVDSETVIAVGNVEELPYVDASIDVVFCTDVLEHVENLTTAARELARVLKANGTLIVRVPYREDLSAYLQRDYPYRLAHLRNFDECSLRLLFERQLGLSTARIDFDYCAMPSLLRLPIPRGKTLLTRALFAAANNLPALETTVSRLFRPLTVTMSFLKLARS